MADVFISYSRSRHDRARAEALCEVLRRAGASFFIDYSELLTGDEWRARLAQELDKAAIVLVLWSKQAVGSSFVRDEASRGLRRKNLLPLIIDDLADGDVPLGFGECQWLRCSWTGEGQASNDTRSHLLDHLRRRLRDLGPLTSAVAQLQSELARKLGPQYEVGERIGAGRMSVVFKGRNGLSGDVALKATPLAGILLLPGFYAEFCRDIEAARQLAHANILPIHDVKLFDTIACTESELVDGGSLAHYLADHGQRPDIGNIRDIASGIAEALVHAHQNGVIHSTLSPSSVLIARAGDRVLVSDFGLPRVGFSPEATAARALFCDARYMSPEQCLGKIPTTHSDQYALGAIVYEMLTGQAPFRGSSTFELMRQHVGTAPPPIAELRPTCPAAVTLTVMKLLSKDPDARYFTTRELAQEIAEWPLAESMGPNDVRRSSTKPGAVKVALESYRRCTANPNFLSDLYKRLKRNKRLSPHLRGINVDHQARMLEKAVRHLLAYQHGEGSHGELDRIAGAHRRFNLQESHIRAFVDALITLVSERDPMACTPAERESLSFAWKEATEAGIRRFVEIAATPPTASGILSLAPVGSEAMAGASR
jgi:serine/threonine protein kinase